MICVDSGQGLLAALPIVYPRVPVQRCWAHKIRNVLDKVRAGERSAVKSDLHAIMNANTLPEARSAARRFAERWHALYPKAVACLREDLEELLTCWRYDSLEERKRVRTTDEMDKRLCRRHGMILGARATSWRRATHRLQAPPGRLTRALPA
jgi:transposase-like protein